MQVTLENSGIQETACFADENVRDIFIPLLEHLSQLHRTSKRRIFVLLAAPPGAGKSTLAAFLEQLSRSREDLVPVTAVSMDGFHHYNEYLLSHTAMIDGQETVLKSIKGAPVTFDLAHLEERIRHVVSGEACGWPQYSRVLHDPVEDAITVEGDIVILEGNYLLLNRDGWEKLKGYADYTIKLNADETVLRERLISRKTRNGTPREEAEAYVDRSDMKNVQACLRESLPADLTLDVIGDGQYRRLCKNMNTSNEMLDILCVGIGVIDITALPMPKPEDWREKQRIKQVSICVGGDAANQACRMADRGMKTAIVACIGNDSNGSSLRSALEDRGIDTRFIAVREDIPTTTAIVLVDDQGERRTFSMDGAHPTLRKEDLKEAWAQPKRAISLGSLFSMPYLEEDGLAQLLDEARARGELIFADLASDKKHQGLEGIRDILPHLDYFLPSETDSLDMTGAATVEEAAAVYRSCGVKNVVIKCGEKGCYYLTEEESGWVPAVPVKPVDTTGAGDTWVGLFVTRILEGDSIRVACENSCQGASQSTLFVGANAGRV
ncbi:MAG: nucleoside/nucleotide kinase family protein [Lachnospiraceae bacterium]|nr:nucleoside/nucleotide kinase family protein [Lachnospiraceae bacterium]